MKPQTRWGAYSALPLPDPLAVFKGPTSKGRGGEGRGQGKGGEAGERKEGEGRGGRCTGEEGRRGKTKPTCDIPV